MHDSSLQIVFHQDIAKDFTSEDPFVTRHSCNTKFIKGGRIKILRHEK